MTKKNEMNATKLSMNELENVNGGFGIRLRHLRKLRHS